MTALKQAFRLGEASFPCMSGPSWKLLDHVNIHADACCNACPLSHTSQSNVNSSTDRSNGQCLVNYIKL